MKEGFIHGVKYEGRAIIGMAIVAERFVGRLDVVRIKYKNDDPTKGVDDPVDLFEMQACHFNAFEL